MAVRPQVPERDRLSERDRLWGLTQPARSLSASAVSTELTLDWRAAASRVVEQACPEVSSVAPADVADGWVPARTTDRQVHAPDQAAQAADTSAHELEASPSDAADVAARRTSALAAASKAYADAHGHPLTHPRAGEGPPRGARRRWAVPVRLALTAALALGLIGGAVALRSASVASAALAPIELPPVGGSPSSPEDGSDDAAGAAPTDGPATAGATVDAEGVESSVSVATVVVHVVGQVASPGVVQLPVGSRVDDAIRAAGGATARADLAALNLARIVIDGEQVVVPAPGDEPSGPGGTPPAGRTAGGAAGSASGTLDLNDADAAALDALPGIGPVLAGRIVDWRTANGRLTSVDQLGEVDGIGPTLLAKLRPLVRV